MIMLSGLKCLFNANFHTSLLGSVSRLGGAEERRAKEEELLSTRVSVSKKGDGAAVKLSMVE